MSNAKTAMLLHLGGDTSVFLKDVIVILDMEKMGRECGFLEPREASEDIGGVKKTAVIVDEGGNIKVYYSPISSRTLQKRANVKNNFWEHIDAE